MNIETFKFSHISIRKVLLLTYFIIVLPPFIIQIAMNTSLINTYRQELITSNMQFVNELKLNMDYNLKELIAMSLTIYSNSECINILNKPYEREYFEKVNDSQKFDNYLQMIIYRNFISGVYIYKLDGDYYFGNSNPGIFDVSANLKTSSWLKNITPKNQDFYFYGTHQPKQLIAGSPVISLVRRIVDTVSGKYLGLMLIDVNPEIIGNAYKNTSSQLDRKFLVVDKENTIIYNSDTTLEMTKLKDNKLSKAFLGSNGHFTFTDKDTDYLVSYSTSNIAGWKFLAIIPLEKVVNKANSIRNSLIWMAVITMVFAIICSLIFSKYISSPLKKLTDKMSWVSKGNFDDSVSLNGTKEVYLLGEGFNLMISRIRSLLKNEFQLKLLKKDAEFKALQAQINPHFLYNTLESISVLADIGKVPKIGKICNILSNMFRYSISIKNDTVPIRRELEHLEDYLCIIKLRFEDMINFNINIEDTELNEYETPKLILQPIVENAVNHGFSDLTTFGLITINALKNEDTINFVISDNGKGMPPEKNNELMEMLRHTTNNNIWEAWQDSSKSIGLRNIHLRLTSYYGSQYGIVSMESIPEEGTSITIAIPAKKFQGGLSDV